MSCSRTTTQWRRWGLNPRVKHSTTEPVASYWRKYTMYRWAFTSNSIEIIISLHTCKIWNLLMARNRSRLWREPLLSGIMRSTKSRVFLSGAGARWNARIFPRVSSLKRALYAHELYSLCVTGNSMVWLAIANFISADCCI